MIIVADDAVGLVDFDLVDWWTLVPRPVDEEAHFGIFTWDYVPTNVHQIISHLFH